MPPPSITIRREEPGYPKARRHTGTPAGPGLQAEHPYRSALELLFALFGSARVAAYVPTLWAIYASWDSSQHSLWTWTIWLGSNVTMALWLWEQNRRRLNKAIVVSAANALMCLTASVLIIATRS